MSDTDQLIRQAQFNGNISRYYIHGNRKIQYIIGRQFAVL